MVYSVLIKAKKVDTDLLSTEQGMYKLLTQEHSITVSLAGSKYEKSLLGKN